MTNKRSKAEKTDDPRAGETGDPEVLDGPDAHANVDATAPTTALSLREHAGALTAIADPDIAMIIRDNLGGDRMDVMSLPTIRIPTGGSDFWMVPTLEGPKPEKEIEGMIVWWTNMRAYWPSSYDDAPNSPPVCTSSDGITGRGNNGVREGDVSYTPDGQEVFNGPHDCETCPLSQFGTKPEKGGGFGKGQACRAARVLFFLGKDKVLPTKIALSPMSIAPARKYFQNLTANAMPYHRVTTKLSLEAAANGAGLKYSRTVLNMGRRLEPGEIAVMEDYRRKILPILGALPVETIMTRADVDRED